MLVEHRVGRQKRASVGGTQGQTPCEAPNLLAQDTRQASCPQGPRNVAPRALRGATRPKGCSPVCGISRSLID